jgi:hypothetical protein
MTQQAPMTNSMSRFAPASVGPKKGQVSCRGRFVCSLSPPWCIRTAGRPNSSRPLFADGPKRLHWPLNEFVRAWPSYIPLGP